MSILKITIFLVLTVAVAVGEVWLVNNPGAVTFYWQDYRIDTSIVVIVHVVALVAVFTAILYRLWGSIRRAPQQIRLWGSLRRERHGYDALSQGLIAAAAGDSHGALRHAKKASALLESPPIAKLLTAQAADLTGDKSTARENFQALADDPQTALLGIRGLMSLARAEGNTDEALRLADEAYRLRPDADGLLAQRLDLQIEAGRWAEAESTVRELVKRKELTAEAGAARRAVTLYEQARGKDAAGDNAAAIKLAEGAVKLNPRFIAAAAKLAALLGQADKVRRGVRVIERCWTETPHPMLAAAYRSLQPDVPPLQQFKRFERLHDCNPDHAESHIALAEAALAAELWGEARAHLEPLAAETVTPRICRLMAELEEREFGATDKAQAWLARTAQSEPDEVWVCGACGSESEIWRARCGNCGGFDTFAWQKPSRVHLLESAQTRELIAAASALPSVPAADTSDTAETADGSNMPDDPGTKEGTARPGL